jgi:hypothetical protein
MSSSAWAKYADALRRISFACRSSRTRKLGRRLQTKNPAHGHMGQEGGVRESARWGEWPRRNDAVNSSGSGRVTLPAIAHQDIRGVISRVSSSHKMICVVFATLNEFRSRAEEQG